MQTHDPHEIPELDPKEQVPGGNQDWEGSAAPESRAALMGEAGLVPQPLWTAGEPGPTTPLGPQPHVCRPSAPTSPCLRTHRCCCEHRDVPLALQIDGTGQALSGPPARHHLGSGPLEAAKAGPSWSPSCPADRQKVQGPVGDSSSANPQSVCSRGPPCLSLPSPSCLQPVEASQRSSNPPCLPVGQAPSRPADALGAPGSAALLQACGAPLPLPPA